MTYQFRGTKSPWSVPHICLENLPCNCTFVLSEQYMGSVCDINYSAEGADWKEGDHAPLEEARANGFLISAAPDLLSAAIEYLEAHKDSNEIYYDFIPKFRNAVHKALNIQDDENKS